eukprot:TRINITY_DN50628_c0_g1_i1.p1 TRINITY_DN50628_c0_g1~~TRINITY_DN50628_c0_g1_i1.p1  ORF type:complete len:341 (+),score=65.92 TRINITY_DN50628_c0_g1_i1:92-1114(+)
MFRWLVLVVAVLVGFVGVYDADVITHTAGMFLDTTGALKGQSVLITGASSGIGRQLALDACTAGASPVLVTARRQDRLEQLQKDCVKAAAAAKHTQTVVAFRAMDMSDLSAHEKFAVWVAEQLKASGGGVDHLVLNAGKGQRAVALEAPFNDTRELMELNYLATVHLARLLVPPMVARHTGLVTVVSSVMGKIGAPLGSSYAASKHALHGYFDALRAELGDSGVGVHLTCPGPVVSEIGQAALRSPTDKADHTAENQGKMATQRCTRLMLGAMAWRLQESWISTQPALVFTYWRQYHPWTFGLVSTRFGPERVKGYKQGSAGFTDITTQAFKGFKRIFTG